MSNNSFKPKPLRGSAKLKVLGAMQTIPAIDPKDVQALWACLEALLPTSWASAQIHGKLADDHGTADFSYMDRSGDAKALDPGFDIYDDAMQILVRMRLAATDAGHPWSQFFFKVSPGGQFHFKYGYGPIDIL
ncbi:hypothetical protein IAE60_00925 [Pseudoxanthomonas mexicana]|uniref:DUF600 family protein n=1 Tax=Pseudoxanthomonas mexicana TaxID=128785 RepID=A0A7G9TD66_PSEMX|nr:hypothetical protein [Pseudoxanthomonas mexicana]QNN78041.1 hypothetical protein IAE60_00925 [Pseudoxanthomonas mexicana]